MTKFGHGNGNWSKTKDLLYSFFSFAIKVPVMDAEENLFKSTSNLFKKEAIIYFYKIFEN